MDRAYTVLSIDELTRIGDTKGIEKYYRHRIKTRGGTVLTVDIDARDLEEDKVRKILTDKAELLDKIKAS